MNQKKSNVPKLHRSLEFQDLLLKFQSIDRIMNIKKHGTQLLENDVEHSYFLAMFAWYYAQFFPELNRDKVIKLALVHDMVEIYAGDTYAYTTDKSHMDSKGDREKKAAERLEKEWKDFPEMNQMIASYESKDCAEARLVYVLDKLLPSYINILNDGYSWHFFKISLLMHEQNKGPKMEHFKELDPLYKELNKYLHEHPELLYEQDQ